MGTPIIPPPVIPPQGDGRPSYPCWGAGGQYNDNLPPKLITVTGIPAARFDLEVPELFTGGQTVIVQTARSANVWEIENLGWIIFIIFGGLGAFCQIRNPDDVAVWESAPGRACPLFFRDELGVWPGPLSVINFTTEI